MRAQLQDRDFDPESHLLAHLTSSSIGVFAALTRIAGFHNGHGDRLTIRQRGVRAGDKVFPHPKDVPVLVLVGLRRINELFEECQSISDDVHVALFAIHHILEVHPFDNGNGRTATSFGQFLLMKRWKIARPPLTLGPNLHRELGEVLRKIETPCTGQSAAELEALSDNIVDRVSKANVASLRNEGPIADLAAILASPLEALAA